MLRDQIVVITGGAGLIGASFAKAIVENNGKVIIGDINEKRGRELENELGQENAIFLKLDTAIPESIDSFLNSASERFEKIDSAVHCAYPRSSQWGTKFEDLKPEGLAEDLSSQLGGAIIFSQKMVAYFRKQGHGNIVHLASIQGVSSPKFHQYEGTKMVSPIEYSAIKSGIISITKYIAAYCKGQNIRSNCISPGGILDKQPEIFLKKYKASCASKGMMDAADLNGTLLYLLSNFSSCVTGQNLIIDDGWIL